jgi:signal transduction histidine kinase
VSVPPTKLPMLTTDGARLRQILSNLVENASKYASDSTIELKVTACAGDGVRFAVVDHGPGIAAEDRERVFGRFVQLDSSSTRAAGGTGLGLYLCRQLAGSLGANLDLAETPGGGCTFTLEIATAASLNLVSLDGRVPALAAAV